LSGQGRREKIKPQKLGNILTLSVTRTKRMEQGSATNANQQGAKLVYRRRTYRERRGTTPIGNSKGTVSRKSRKGGKPLQLRYPSHDGGNRLRLAIPKEPLEHYKVGGGGWRGAWGVGGGIF